MHPNTQYYDRLATVYDRATEPPGAWAPPSFIAGVIKANNLDQGRILDIGIGTGCSIETLYETGCRDIVGVDCSANMLAECRRKYPDIVLVEGRFEEVDLTAYAPFDLIISSGAIEFMNDLPLAIQKVADNLKKDGVFLFTYEPLIEGHEIQREPKSLVVSNQTSAYFVSDFFTYRYRPSTVNDYIRSAGLTIQLDEEFVSYKKLDNLIIYHCIMAKKH
jgi:predicted TPR repeat methyltransferase